MRFSFSYIRDSHKQIVRFGNSDKASISITGDGTT